MKVFVINHTEGGITRIDDSCVLTGKALEAHLQRCGIRRKESNEKGTE